MLLESQTPVFGMYLAAKACLRGCVVHTRKSTEGGLDQDFTSLQAQREAAEAYIQSQKTSGLGHS